MSMQVWIDETQLDAVDSIEAALELARKHTEESGRLIIDIAADGQPIDDNLIDEPPTDTAGINELRLTTTDFAAFLTETINSAKEALDLTETDQQSTADQIRDGEYELAIETLKSVLEGWHAVRDVVSQSAALAGIDIDSLKVTNAKGEPISGAQCVEDLSKALAEIRNCLGKQDWASLGDAIEYDLDEQIPAWNALLDAMIASFTSDP